MSGTQPETILSSTGFGPPHDLETDSKSFSISGAHLMKPRFQKLYLGFCFKFEPNEKLEPENNNNNNNDDAIELFSLGGEITFISSIKVMRRPHG